MSDSWVLDVSGAGALSVSLSPCMMPEF